MSIQDRIVQVRTRLAERLRTFRPDPRAYATAFCVGATIGEYAALAGSTDPAAVLAAVGALGSALGVNLLADIIGEREQPPGLTAEEIAQAVQERLEQGNDLPAVRALLREVDLLGVALESWQRTDARLARLVDELSTHPQLIAAQVTRDVVTALDPKLVSLEQRLETLQRLFTQALLETPPSPLSRVAMDALAREYAAEVQRRYAETLRRLALPRDPYVALADDVQPPPEPPIPRLDDPFLPREFELLWRDPAAPQTEPKREHYDDLRRALERHPHLVLLGDPGAGKTTTLWRLMSDYTATAEESPAVLPMLTPFSTYRGQDLLTFVREQLAAATETTGDGSDGRERPLLAHRRLARYLEDFVAAGYRFAFLFDALNEMPRALFAEAMARLRDLRPRLVGHLWVLTCRQADYPATERLSELAEATIAPLSPKQQQVFLRAYLPGTGEAVYRELEQHHRSLLELGRNPYFLRMVTAVYERGGVLPANRAELFTRFVDVLLAREYDRWQKRYWGQLEAPPWPGDAVRETLATLAYAMGRDGHWGASVERAFWEEAFPTVDAQGQPLSREDLLNVARSAVLAELDAVGTLRFTHQLLQEYFAAVHLNTLGPDHPAVQECLRYDAWDETVVLLAGLTPHLERLVAHLLPLDPFLAARCIGVQPEAISSDVAARLVELLSKLAEDFYSLQREQAIAALGDSPSCWTRQSPSASLQREQAIAALGDTHLTSTVLHLLYLLQNQPDDIRRAAAQALGVLGAREAIPTLIKRLHDEDWEVRKATTQALERLWTREDIHALIEQLRDADRIVDEATVQALGKLWMREDVPALIEWLRDDGKQVRQAAAQALGKLGAREAIPALIERLWDADLFVQEAIAQALEKLWTREDIPALIERLRNESEYVRRVAAQALGKLGAREAIPALIERLRDESEWVRWAAALALGKLGALEVISTLIEQLRGESEWVREWVRRVTAPASPESGAPLETSLV